MVAQPLTNHALEALQPIFELFEQHGHSVYCVGGWVRDRIMNAPIGDDCDLCTSALPEQSEAILRDAGYRTFNLGARFGTIAARVGGLDVEITTYRSSETYPAEGRHPEVVFGTNVHDDLSRRDLSINAMAMNRRGELIDPFNGRDAIAARMLEVPGGGLANTRSILDDDPLRLLRVARFAARFGFTPTPETTQAATECADKLRKISRERWKAEIDRTLIAPHVEDGFAWLHRTGALSVIFPAWTREDHARALFVAWHVAQCRQSGTPLLGWAALCVHYAWATTGRDALVLESDREAWLSYEDAQRTANTIGKRFRMSNQQRADLTRMTTLEPLLGPQGHRAEASVIHRQLVALGGLADAQVALLRALVSRPGDAWLQSIAGALDPSSRTSSPPPWLDALRSNQSADMTRMVESYAAELEAIRAEGDPEPRLPHQLGTILIERVPMRRGPRVGAAITAITDAVYKGELELEPTVDACVDFARAWLADQPK